MNKWQEVWNKDERVNKIILEMLIKADGFDSGAGSFGVDDWLIYTKDFFEKLGIKKNDSIYDVGCGSGAFVYALYLRHHKVGGVDYSMILVDLAKTIMPHSDFKCDEAISIDGTKYDYVLSHSVFHYFRDLDYAEKVIEKMIRKAKKKIAIYDINDKSKENEYNEIRMQNMSKEEYEKKYKGLEHMFYEKEWFVKIAKKYNCAIEICDQDFQNYTNSKLRFNVILEKR